MKKNKILIPVLMTGMMLSFNALAEDEEDLTIPSYENCKNGTASCTELGWASNRTYYALTPVYDNGEPVYIDEEKTIQAKKMGIYGPTAEGSSATVYSQPFVGMFPVGVTSIEVTGNITELPSSFSSGWSDNKETVKSITLPEKLVKIGENAFSSVTGVTSLKIPDSVTEIGSGAFHGMIGVQGRLEIPSGVTSIGDRAFYGMRGVTSFTIPAGVTNIGTQVFYGMTGVTELTIPRTVKNIGNQAFREMTGITNLVIPDSVESIGNSAFMGCTNLKSLTIPDNATIEHDAFYGVNATNLTVSEDQLEAFLTTGRGGLKKDENGKINIICTKGDCEKYLREESKYKTNTALLAGLKVVPLRLEKELADGSIAIYEMGVFKGYKNKRIYTVEEAAAVSKKTGNTFRLRYK
ncbi:MAG: leucine-rich repeat domain-containing protein [Alphaproteobacteria bacterium]|nr:leucine-rich repeat domain-containing protein [Alphaproteobacteria bacterium]